MFVHQNGTTYTKLWRKFRQFLAQFSRQFSAHVSGKFWEYMSKTATNNIITISPRPVKLSCQPSYMSIF